MGKLRRDYTSSVMTYLINIRAYSSFNGYAGSVSFIQSPTLHSCNIIRRRNKVARNTHFTAGSQKKKNLLSVGTVAADVNGFVLSQVNSLR
jgi:hypothetical protein